MLWEHEVHATVLQLFHIGNHGFAIAIVFKNYHFILSSAELRVMI
jgi:hypothetical protein